MALDLATVTMTLVLPVIKVASKALRISVEHATVAVESAGCRAAHEGFEASRTWGGRLPAGLAALSSMGLQEVAVR